jgi:hypothetical protein
MKTLNKRATVYFDPKVHKVLKLQALETGKSVSEIINEAVCREMELDREDLAAFDQRKNEKTISYETLLKELKQDGKI